MTDKKENILNAALELFAKEGYSGTSTSKIAKKAGVSEGLIFRHFKNKQGLLDAILQETEAKIKSILMDIIFETDSKKVLRKLIELPFKVKESEFDFWKLQFILKWQPEYDNPDKMKPLIDKLEQVFQDLGYNNPRLEALLLNQLVDSISSEILKGHKALQLEIRDFLLDKYGV